MSYGVIACYATLMRSSAASFDTFYSLIEECWSDNPADRPTFKQIIPRLDAIYNRFGHRRRWKVFSILSRPSPSLNAFLLFNFLKHIDWTSSVLLMCEIVSVFQLLFALFSDVVYINCDFCAGDEAIEMLPEFRLDARWFEQNAFDSLLLKLQIALQLCWLMKMLFEMKSSSFVAFSDSEYSYCCVNLLFSLTLYRNMY